MTPRSLVCWTALPLLLSSPALAAPATQDQAQRLTEIFQRYIGKPAPGQPSAVTVTPRGESYIAAFDISKVMAPLASFGMSMVGTGPYTMVLTPQDDGLWRVTSDGIPSLAFTNKKQTVTLNYNGYTFDGLFDPKLESMKQGTSTLSGATSESVSPDLSSRTQYTGQFTNKQTSEPAGDGSVNMNVSQSVANFDYKLDMTMPSAGQDNPPTKLPIGMGLDSALAETKVSHVSTVAVLDLWQFLVAHPSKAAIQADKEDFKAKLRAVLAPNPTLSVQAHGQKFSASTPVGPFSLDQIDEHVALSGDADKESFVFGLKGSGLSVPPDKLPVWLTSLIPTSFDLGFRIEPLRLHNGLRKVIDDVDFASDTPLTDDQRQDVLKAFGDLDKLALTLDPTTISSRLMVVKVDGKAAMALDNPSATFHVAATGLDKAVETLQASVANNPDAAQALGMLALAKQLGKATGPDAYSWTIDFGASGVMVNGQPLSTAPKEDPDSDPDSDDDSKGGQQ